MTAGLWVQLVIGIITVSGTVYGTMAVNKKSAALMQYRLEQLEQKVDKHNNLVERTFDLERRIAVNEEKVKVVNHRLDDIEREAHA